MILASVPATTSAGNQVYQQLQQRILFNRGTVSFRKTTFKPPANMSEALQNINITLIYEYMRNKFKCYTVASLLMTNTSAVLRQTAQGRPLSAYQSLR